jgi:HKD family nuclease
MEQNPTYEQLYQFYLEVAKLTLEHDVLAFSENHEYIAVVYSSNLDKELEKVNQEWYEDIK